MAAPNNFYYEETTAYGSRLRQGTYTPIDEDLGKNLLEFLDKFKDELTLIIPPLLQTQKGLKIWVVIKVEYIHPTKPSKMIPAILHSKYHTIQNEELMDGEITIIFNEILSRNAGFQQEKSGLVLAQILSAELSISKYVPSVPITHGGSFVELPKFILHKKCIINVHNTDNRCFGYSILSALHTPKFHPERLYHYKESLWTEHRLNQI